jgi:hypothetical protein
LIFTYHMEIRHGRLRRKKSRDIISWAEIKVQRRSILRRCIRGPLLSSAGGP